MEQEARKEILDKVINEHNKFLKASKQIFT